MSVSVIIPAYNAEATLAQALESLLAQTFGDWEAIVVDDGSTDGTLAVAERFAKQDARIRTVGGPHAGVSAARNAGLALARHDWLLFLDADDWIAPMHFERLTARLRAEPDLDAVYCHWAFVADDGTAFEWQRPAAQGDLFPQFARSCIFPIHACLVRCTLVHALGGFDALLQTCEDWDLWQRVARTGARFGAIPETLAFYRLRPHSASTNSRRMLEDGFCVISRGHGPDSRVPHPSFLHAAGVTTEELPAVNSYMATYAVGLALGLGEDPLPLLALLESTRRTALDPESIAKTLFESILIPMAKPPTMWHVVYTDMAQRIERVLQVLEARSTTPALARCTIVSLERLILQHARAVFPLKVGATHGVRIEVTEPIQDLKLPVSVWRLIGSVEVEGHPMGFIELPVCDGLVPADVLADAVAAKFAWVLLGRFFERTLYPTFVVEPGANGCAITRDGLLLGEAPVEQGNNGWKRAHDDIGWTVFLQELWGYPGWAGGRFYVSEVLPEHTALKRIEGSRLTVEVSEPLPNLEVAGERLHIVPMVGGVALGVFELLVREHRVSGGDLRTAITTEAGFELCRAAVREGLLGRRLDAKPMALRDRLRAARTDSRPVSRSRGIVLGRRVPDAFDSSVSRRARLPSAAVPEILEAASVAGEPVVHQGAVQKGEPSQASYDPSLVCETTSGRPGAAPSDAAAPQSPSPTPSSSYDRLYFEKLFASQADPWDYTSDYEQRKYAHTLSLLPPAPIHRALELACAEGHFTTQLAPRVERLVAVDLSKIALSRAAERCAEFPNVEFLPLDLIHDPLPGLFDLIVCSEVLYYSGGRETLAALARKFADALEPGGCLLTTHANLVIDEPDQPGFDWDHPFGANVISQTLASESRLQLVRELRTPLYRVQLFRRQVGNDTTAVTVELEVTETAECGTLRPEAAAHILWHGGRPDGDPTRVVTTAQLPILMYHRIAPAGSAATARYRLSPEAFQEQLQYLRDSGFYTINLEKWGAAMRARRPLPGRAILITFDDGYCDLLTDAWPLLKRYGFSATAFLVAGEIGGRSRWDAAYGEEAPLLGWDEIRQLQAEGIEFESHGTTHRPLTALSPTDIAQEAARSRAILQRELKRPVRAIAYPYGLTDGAVEHLTGACGYLYGVTCHYRLAELTDQPLALPRLEVMGGDTLKDFVSKLHVT